MVFGEFMTFSFNHDQIETLKGWKSGLDTEDAHSWAVSEAKAHDKIMALFGKVNFANGGNLTESDFDELFKLMKKFIGNRNLSNLLYRNSGIENFNNQLRNLYYGQEPLPKRIDKTFEIKSMGMQTVSQLLVVFDAGKYPVITSVIRNALDDILVLDASQWEEARRDAIIKNNITHIEEYHDRTLDFLTFGIILEQIKNILELNSYTKINNLIWLGSHKEDSEGDSPVIPFTSVSLEKDLRDYLANNPSTIENNLTLIQKEYPTNEVGTIDLLCNDRDGHKVIVELKKGRETDKVVGQTLRYLGWISKNQDPNTRAIIVVNEPDEKLDFAVYPLKDKIKVKYYKVKFEVSDTP